MLVGLAFRWVLRISRGMLWVVSPGLPRVDLAAGRVRSFCKLAGCAFTPSSRWSAAGVQAAARSATSESAWRSAC